MNDVRPTGRSGRHPTPEEMQALRRRRAAAEKRRRRQRARLYFRIKQFLLVLAAFLIGFYFGSRSANAEAVPAETQPPAETQSQVQQQPELPKEPADKVAPQILGVNKIAVFLGSTVSYRSGILVSDDNDPAPQLSVDSSQVNLSAAGTYPLYYSATDSAGNITTIETTVTVSEAPDSYVDEALIKEKADELLAKILTEGMSPEEQVNAVYEWIEGHCYYIAEFDKSDYMQAAYLMLTNNRGDCYGFYAVSRLLFERMGLPNLTVTRLPNEVRTSNHWWNMVSLDNGATWYHFDSTPHLTYPTRTCLVTDTFLNDFNLLMPNYYYFDHEAFPETPTE